MTVSAQLFVSPEARVLDGWRTAFGELVCVASPCALAEHAADALVWLDVEVDAWADLVHALSTRGRRVVVLSSTPNSEQALQALEAGARGYCHAFATPEMLREVALVLRHGGLWVGPELLARMIRAAVPATQTLATEAPRAALSAREREVAVAVAEGLTNKQVAARLAITERTVKAHLAAVFDKLGVRDRLQLALRISRRRP